MLKRLSALILTLVLLAGTVACTSEPETEIYESDVQEVIDNPAPVVPPAQEESIDVIDDDIPFLLPEMTAQQQHYRDDYVSKLLWAGMLITNWSSDATDEIVGLGLLWTFEDIIGREAMQTLWSEHNFHFPADLIEEVLLRWFPFTTEQLREILYEFYDEYNQTYFFPDGRGGPSFEAIVTNIERQGEFVKLSYDFYWRPVWDPQQWERGNSGILTLRQTDYGYMFWSVTLKANYDNGPQNPV